MKPLLAGIFLSGLLLFAFEASGAEIEGFVGYSSMQVAPNVTVKLINGKSGEVSDIDETNFFGKYSFEEVKPGYYKVQVGDISREVMIKKANQEKRLDIDLSAEGGAMDYGKDSSSASSQKPASQGTPAQAASNNQTLANQIAGVWWGYAGSTERRIGLCPGGSYVDYTESSYSSGGYSNQGAAWGAASQSGGQGSWTIQGDTQSGVISVRYNNGSATTLRYSQINDPGCLDINGSTLCRSSATCQ